MVVYKSRIILIHKRLLQIHLDKVKETRFKRITLIGQLKQKFVYGK